VSTDDDLTAIITRLGFVTRPELDAMNTRLGALESELTATVSPLADILTRLRALEKPPVNPRDAMVYGVTKPTPELVGATGPLDIATGDFPTTAHGQVVKDRRITGQVKIRHDGVSFHNCRIEGGVEAFQARTSPTVGIDCTIIAPTGGNAVQGRDFTLERCDISGSVDGIGMQGTNARAFGCWIHDLIPGVDLRQPDKVTHNDGVQVHNGTGHRIVGCLIQMGAKTNAAIMVNQNSGLTSDLVIDRNWIESTAPGGFACPVGVNVAEGGKGTITKLTITGNRFTPAASWRTGWAALVDLPSRNAATIRGNVIVGTTELARGLHHGGA